jgi:hypothetical protein
MKLSALRWLLDPTTSLLAMRLRAQERGRMSYDVAWRLARVTLRVPIIRPSRSEPWFPRLDGVR